MSSGFTGTDGLIASVFAEVLTHSAGALVHDGNAYTVVRSFAPGADLQMLSAGYDSECDAIALLRVADIVGAGPAIHDTCTLDGANYIVWKPIDKNPVYWQIPLKEA